MPGIIAASTSGWSYGASILSFLFPMILFLVVATSLYVVFTKPSVVPGHREQTVARPIGFTPVAGISGSGRQAAGPHYAFPAQAGQAEPRAGAPENPAARPGNPGAAE